MNCRDIISKIEEHYPRETAEEWDNPGLLAGRLDRPVKRIFVALDVTDQTLAEAVAWKADLMITHHPLIFSAIRQVNDQDIIGRRLVSLIENGISYYAMHTNFDVTGMAKLNEKQLGLLDSVPLTPGGEKDGEVYGIGRVGMLPAPVSLPDFAAKVREVMELPAVRCYGPQGSDADAADDCMIQIVAVCGGSGKSVINDAIAAGADVMVTGDIDYHTGIDTVSKGMYLIDAGHYGTEHCFVGYMADRCREWFPSCEVKSCTEQSPYQVI